MPDPIRDIEDKQGQIDTGVMLARIYQGAFEESGSIVAAFWVTCACFCGMLKSIEEKPDEDSNGT